MEYGLACCSYVALPCLDVGSETRRLRINRVPCIGRKACHMSSLVRTLMVRPVASVDALRRAAFVLAWGAGEGNPKPRGYWGKLAFFMPTPSP